MLSRQLSWMPCSREISASTVRVKDTIQWLLIVVYSEYQMVAYGVVISMVIFQWLMGLLLLVVIISNC